MVDEQIYMVTCDLEYLVTSWSGVAEVVFGIPVDEAIGKPMAEVICTKEFAGACWAIFLEVRNGNFEWVGEMLARRASGELFQSEVKISPIHDSGGIVIGLSAVGRDLTSRQLEESPRVDFAKYLVNECNLTPSTAFTYEQGLLRLEKFIGKDASEITPDEIRAFMRNTDYHPATKSSTLVAMKAFHKWGSLEGLWPMNGIMALRAPKQVIIPKPALSADEARTLIDACRRNNEFRLVYLGLYQGTRITESSLIGDREWNHMKGSLRFEGKGRKVREIPVHPEVALKRKKILEGNASRGTLKHVARSLAFYTGVDYTSHSLRRTFSVMLSEARVPREVIGAMLGHAPISTTERYTPVRFDEMQEAIAKLVY